MTRTEAEWASWAREHRAAFQTAPLIEAVKGERLQVTAADRDRVNQVEKRLLAFGVKQGRA